jgi:hypothetical protein
MALFLTATIFTRQLADAGRRVFFFGIYSVFGESVREGGCSPSLKTLKNRWPVRHPKCATL